MAQRTLSHEQWLDEGRERFGECVMQWRFVCPSCGHVASVQDWKDAGASTGEVAFSCIGRRIADPAAAAAAAFKGAGGPCNYTSGGLFQISPVIVVLDEHTAWTCFEFAEVPHAA